MIILGIDLDKCSATEMFEKLEYEVEFQKTVAKAHATLAVNCYRRDFIEDKDFIPNGECSFISDEQYIQMKTEFSQHNILERYIGDKNQEMRDIFRFSTLFQEEQEFFKNKEKMFSSHSERYQELFKNILEVKSYISTIERYYNKYKKIN